MLVILSGVAGAGKDTVKNEVIKRMQNVVSIPSITDRPMRPGDIPNETYIFVSNDEFKKMIDNNELFEFDIHHNHYYGVPKKYLREKVQEGKIVIKDVDVNGTENLVRILKEEMNVVTIFLRVSREELRKRLENRVDKPDEKEIELRLSRFDFEESKISNYDYVIDNVNQEETVQKVMKIIEEASSK